MEIEGGICSGRNKEHAQIVSWETPLKAISWKTEMAITAYD
jgi:hypothetical protein